MDDAEFADVSVSAESARSAWKIGFNGYFPWIGYVVSFRIVLTSPMNKW